MAKENLYNQPDGESSTNNDFTDDNKNADNTDVQYFHGNEPDIGLGDNCPGTSKKILNNNETKISRKEDNIVSFKRFLSCNSNVRNATATCHDVYNSAGKDNSPVASSSGFSQCSVINSDISSSLPDFVQDHLAMEQHYFNRTASTNYDIANAIPKVTSYDPNIGDKQFDAGKSINLSSNNYKQGTSYLHSRCTNNQFETNGKDYATPNRRNHSQSQNHFDSGVCTKGRANIPPDLPVNGTNYYEMNEEHKALSISSELLPFDLTHGNKLNENNERSSPAHARSSMSGMPDFLADSHVYDHTSRLSRQSSTTDSNQPELSPLNEIEQLQMENRSLRDVIRDLRTCVHQQASRLNQLEYELHKTKSIGWKCSSCQRNNLTDNFIPESSPNSCNPSTSSTNIHDSSLAFNLNRNTDDAMELAGKLINSLGKIKLISQNLVNKFPDKDVSRKFRQNDSDSSD